MYFFDNHINAFLVEGLHDIPVDAIAVSDNEYGDYVFF
uniref:Uncharacterized protein n=1 Tax=Podoviridae sp. ctzeq1 TaxID=2826597 RepID=A0A8S5M0H0_9CAUD|nr:MAG TPA: hypothetical protein [Podoviridae sp. ctzeq1]